MKKALDFSVAVFVEELLQEHHCVVIPGLGAFIANDVPGVYSAATHEFSPPQRQISFNVRLTNNDGLLCNKIITKTGLSFNEALEIIGLEVKRFTAQTQNRWEFEGIGHLSTDANALVEFQPASQTNLLAASFGLNGLYVSPVQQLQPVVIRLNETANSKANAPIIRKLVYAASAAAVLCLMFIGAYQFSPIGNHSMLGFSGNLKPAYSPSEYIFELEESSSVTLEKGTKFSLYSFKEVAESEPGVMLDTLEAPPAESAQASVSTDKFNIVVGAFSNESLARKLFDELKAEGFSPKLLPSASAGLTIVSAHSFQTENEAFDYLPKVSTKHRDAWVKANW